MSHPIFLHGRRSGLCAAALLISTTLMLGGCAAGPNSEAKAAETKDEKKVESVPVEVAVASRRAVAASYTGTAALEPRAESQVVAKTSGVALAVLVEEGQRVSAGQPLVRLDPDRARLAVAQSEAQMRKLENNYQRAQKLVGQQMVSAADVDQLRFDLENVRAQYRLATLELSYTTVVAPISGVIASRSIKTGNFVQINTPIFRIVDNSRLEATLNVPERELATLRAGQPVTLSADALPGQSFTGIVDRIAPVVDSGSGTFRVVSAFDGTAHSLQPGMFGRIRIDYDQRADALVVPRLALLDDGEPAVFRVRDGKVARVPVKLGYAEGPWVEIRDGLAAGDQVVTAGKVALRDGTAVQVIADPKAKTATASAKPADKAGSRQ
ncbi:efflux RND transporter periplasmic adaptor subunit [Stenotrophomonas maltophilia]|jgi:membrane fusion protein (multidrug efflux system)|uniref:Efflux transporter periplasmic adaptor subunit n=1 Tax=Stenotrophomonas maltophilia TaxID=40324 RepID=A0AAP7GWN3_STEMA|nr:MULTISPECIES: efflux RND transporter periplasmic adaptor subunit [Stenotrophomonas]KOQ69718.1 hemolysin D [Stenotrophomonas maltophilia]MBA0222640.1 efflux RND transporter periplasmic adaptor subunit [Stenotrophomonas maltophilia]MBE5270549.1 efflux RND transporter periplasmic adaptor subunit [Stenotrophomonas sp. B2]MBH1666021.1 efflux RND transporter periplasmic adaptor subunit [Stenotrophomonas maltophilia]MBH1837595.1 efflux RND transporter periplasmic adaptor subunit [Stenotrophomonas 